MHRTAEPVRGSPAGVLSYHANAVSSVEATKDPSTMPAPTFRAHRRCFDAYAARLRGTSDGPTVVRNPSSFLQVRTGRGGLGAPHRLPGERPHDDGSRICGGTPPARTRCPGRRSASRGLLGAPAETMRQA